MNDQSDETVQSDAPPTFADLGLGDAVLKALKDVGYEIPSAIQVETIPSLLEVRDFFGLAHT